MLDATCYQVFLMSGNPVNGLRKLFDIPLDNRWGLTLAGLD
jgi:hypothetical protein